MLTKLRPISPKLCLFPYFSRRWAARIARSREKFRKRRVTSIVVVKAPRDHSVVLVFLGLSLVYVPVHGSCFWRTVEGCRGY